MPGTFVFRPIEANLTHDTDWLGKMDPYCAYMMNNKRIKGQVCKSGGQHPVWNEATTVPSEIDQPACVVELMDKDTFIDDSIGTFVVDLNEVRNYGTVSKWYPVFHKNKPAGQILFEAAYQPAQQNIQVIQPVIHETVFVEEVPKKAIIEETVIQKEVLPQETFTQSSFISKGGVIPVGSTNLDGGLYGKVVHAQPVSHLPNQQLSGTGVYQDTLTRTELGGPLSGSLGGGVLGTRELTGQGFIGTATTHQESIGTTRRVVDTQVTESQYVTSQTVGNQLSGTGITQTYGNQNFGSQGLGNQGLLNQNAINQGMGQNLPINFNSTSVSNAQLGGGAPLYQETANHPTAKPTTTKSHLKGANKGEIVDPDLIGGHTQTNQNYGNQF